MVSRSLSLFSIRSTQLLLGATLGLIAFGSSAPKAAANPLQALPIVGDLLGGRPAPPPMPTELDIFHDNVQGNHVNLCVLTCNTPGTPGGIPQGIPSAARALPPGMIPPGAIPPGAIPPGAIPPGAIPPGARPPAPPQRNSNPNVTLDLSPIRIPL